MEQTPNEFPRLHELSDDELADDIGSEAADAEPISQDRAQRFYDRIRGSIQRYIDRKGGALGKTAEYLLLVPDVFILLWRMANDKRVAGKEKVLLVSGIAYFVFPFDLIPEGLLGPVGYLDDLIFGVFVLNKLLTSVDVEVLREHWSGSEDVLQMIHRVVSAADQLVGSDLVGRLKRMVK